MKIFKKQIPVRHILYVVLGWLHATMLCVPLYALVLNFVSEGMTKDVILQNILRGFLILAPIALSWFAIKCLRRIFFYILASIGITVLTGFLFDSVLMAVVALFICFMRLYGRLHGESYSLSCRVRRAVPVLCLHRPRRFDFPARLPRFRGRLLRAVPHAARYPPYR